MTVVVVEVMDSGAALRRKAASRFRKARRVASQHSLLPW